jgi:hypothetical protein
MKVLSESSLVSALVAWGVHEAMGRHQGKADCQITDRLNVLDWLLRARAPYVQLILGRQPVKTLMVELEPEDEPSMLLADGRSVDDWIEGERQHNAQAWAHVQRMVASPDAASGAWVGAATLLDAEKNQLGPVVLYDGWHRAAAWRECCKMGRPSAQRAFLVLTQRD